jgi:quercetin dioxygenase-like cupin family protein
MKCMLRSTLVLGAVASLLALAASCATPTQRAGHRAEARVSMVYDHVLPNVAGKSLRAVLVEYEPGASSPAHVHAPSAFIYATVLEGAVRSQINDGPVTVYRAGESFSENPGDRHVVSANASTTQRARLLAVFVVDTDDAVLTTPTE